MTPEMAHSVATRARALRGGLAPSADPVAVATAARRLFEDAGDEVRVRWLNLELQGYEPAMSAIGPLPRVLRVPPHDRLAAHVAAYRTQRATEDGAEGIALGIVGHHRPRWRLVRRLQSKRGERADWLFAADPNGAWVVLEISGTDAAAIGPRENEKRAQAASSTVARRAAACVVRFLEPRASLWESAPDGPC